MLRAVILVGSQNAATMKQDTHRQLDIVTDSARLFDRFALTVSRLFTSHKWFVCSVSYNWK